MRIETVQIKGKDGKPVNINKSDYDKDKHSLIKGKKEASQSK